MSEVVPLGKINQAYAVLATTNGRDKVYRLVQYLARLISWYLVRKGSIDTADRFIGLKNGLMQARRALRLLRNGEFFQAAIKLSQKPVSNLSGHGQLAHFAQIGRQLGYAGYFATDQMLWLAGVGVTRPTKERLAAIQRISMRCWLIGIILSIGSSSASLVKLRADGRRFALTQAAARKENTEKSPEEKVRAEEERREKGRALLAQRATLMSQLVTDACDVWIPSNNLGYTNLNDGIIGLLGAFTSYTALQTLWLKHNAAASRKQI